MIDFAEKIIFAARARQGRSQLRIRERAAERAEPAHSPNRHDGEPSRQIADLKPEAGENAGADHVRDDDARRRQRRNGFGALGVWNLNSPGDDVGVARDGVNAKGWMESMTTTNDSRSTVDHSGTLDLKLPLRAGHRWTRNG